MSLEADILALEHRAREWIKGARAHAFKGIALTASSFTFAMISLIAGFSIIGLCSFAISVTVALMGAHLQREAMDVEEEFLQRPLFRKPLSDRHFVGD